MRKLHLPARVPNEGAHRLAWFIVDMGDEAWTRLARMAGLTEHVVDRMIAGELEPAAETSHFIFLATDGGVRTSDWRRPAIMRSWFDRPTEWQSAKAA